MTQSSVAYHANQAYRSTAVAVPPLKAVVLLYSGTITLLQKAVDAQEACRFEEGHDHLTRATAILRGLSHNLDFTRGGAVADRLYLTYNALILACLRSYGRRQARESFQRIITSLTRLRESWEFVESRPLVTSPRISISLVPGDSDCMLTDGNVPTKSTIPESPLLSSWSGEIALIAIGIDCRFCSPTRDALTTTSSRA